MCASVSIKIMCWSMNIIVNLRNSANDYKNVSRNESLFRLPSSYGHLHIPSTALHVDLNFRIASVISRRYVRHRRRSRGKCAPTAGLAPHPPVLLKSAIP